MAPRRTNRGVLAGSNSSDAFVDTSRRRAKTAADKAISLLYTKPKQIRYLNADRSEFTVRRNDYEDHYRPWIEGFSTWTHPNPSWKRGPRRRRRVLPNSDLSPTVQQAGPFFRKLPAEIRLQILKYVFDNVERIRIDINSKGLRHYKGVKSMSWLDDGQETNIHRGHWNPDHTNGLINLLALNLCSRQMRAEARTAFFEVVTFFLPIDLSKRFNVYVLPKVPLLEQIQNLDILLAFHGHGRRTTDEPLCRDIVTALLPIVNKRGPLKSLTLVFHMAEPQSVVLDEWIQCLRSIQVVRNKAGTRVTVRKPARHQRLVAPSNEAMEKLRMAIVASA